MADPSELVPGRFHDLKPLFDMMLTVAVVGGFLYAFCLAWSIPLTSWLTSAGIVGIAVGFAAKDTLANLFSGIFIIAGAVDRSVIGRTSEVFEALISAEKQAADNHGDHFAEAGANDRLWNALEKLAVADPEVFVDYYRNDMLALGAMALIGTGMFMFFRKGGWLD